MNCQKHPEKEASFFCSNCGIALCQECVKRRDPASYVENAFLSRRRSMFKQRFRPLLSRKMRSAPMSKALRETLTVLPELLLL